jgi:FlaA1/EpsC-like NDP-sugar epimerase
VRNRIFLASDALLIPLCTWLAFVARYDGLWTAQLTTVFVVFLAVTGVLKIGALFSLGMYRRLWQYASVRDVERTVYAASVCAIIGICIGALVIPLLGLIPGHISYAVILLDACLSALAITSPRLAARMWTSRDTRRHLGLTRRAVIIGAGAAGGMIVRELLENVQLGILPVAVLDDNPNKHGLHLHNVPVLGALDGVEDIARRVGATDVIIAMPSAPGRMLRSVVNQAMAAGLQTRTVPGLYEILSGEKRVDALRQIAIEDLLRREPITTDAAQVASLVTGKTVLVTGAGGSIGSELCRQLARLEPSRVVALGRGENSIFELMRELKRAFPRLDIVPIIADVRDWERINHVLARYRPFSVFHAAAHKHVPLMETNVADAVLNNVLGTRNIVTLSMEHDVEHFVLISSDKAVRSTSVMGATKRIAEQLVYRCALEGGRSYVSVRFGNVLGSRGSVVPTFMRQIAEGGPVTITHPDMTRYFMTIPEAVQLVLQAAALGTDGEVFVLDMGEPVRVFDLATDLIRLSGLETDVDVEVHFTGARPGEKLYEELFFQGDGVTPTTHPKILRARDAESAFERTVDIDALIDAARANVAESTLRRLILKVVPEYSGAVTTADAEECASGPQAADPIGLLA